MTLMDIIPGGIVTLMDILPSKRFDTPSTLIDVLPSTLIDLIPSEAPPLHISSYLAL